MKKLLPIQTKSTNYPSPAVCYHIPHRTVHIMVAVHPHHFCGQRRRRSGQLNIPSSSPGNLHALIDPTAVHSPINELVCTSSGSRSEGQGLSAVTLLKNLERVLVNRYVIGAMRDKVSSNRVSRYLDITATCQNKSGT